MPLFTVIELLSLLVTTIVVGYIFSGFVRKPDEDVLARYKYFKFEDITFATAVAAPGIILHELAHKFVAIAYGLDAHFEIWPTGLVIGVILKILNTGFMLLAPGYVTIIGASPFTSMLTALAGPLTNATLWIGAFLTLKYARHLTHSTALFLGLTQNINKWLFIFNMIPIPPLDGFKVLIGILGIFS